MRRTVLLGAVLAVVAASAGIGWFFGSRIKSPAEVAAEAEAPEPSNIAVEVELVELSADVITRGDIVYDEPVTVGLSGSFAEQPDALVVTDVVDLDATLNEGSRAVEIAGRPVFFLIGEIPMYRDLRPGSTGVDVLQLEAALARLGYFAGTPDETWDQATGAAVASWYDAAGYRVNGLSDEEEQALRAARRRVTDAQAAVADAQGSTSGAGQAELLSAQSQIDAAESALELALLDRDRALAQAEAPERQTQAALDAAAFARFDAGRRLSAAEGGEHPDTGKPPTPAELSALREELADARAAEAEAQQAHDEAAAELRRVRIEQGSIVDQARDAVAIARAALSDLRRSRDAGGAARQVNAARDELSEAQRDLARMESELGTWLPAGELVFLDRMPVRVDQIAAERGSIVIDSFMTVSGSELAVRAAVSEVDATRLSEGQPVQIDNPESGVPVPGSIVRVADRPGTNGVAADRVYVEILPEGEVSTEVVGQNVRIVIPVSSTGGRVLAVPAAALSATADGSTIVQVDDGGELRTVEVETGLAAEGLVEVTPVAGGTLSEGDFVVVGREAGQDSGGG